MDSPGVELIFEKNEYENTDMNSINKRVGFFVLNALNIINLNLIFRNFILIYYWKQHNPKMDVRKMLFMNIGLLFIVIGKFILIYSYFIAFLIQQF